MDALPTGWRCEAIAQHDHDTVVTLVYDVGEGRIANLYGVGATQDGAILDASFKARMIGEGIALARPSGGPAGGAVHG